MDSMQSSFKRRRLVIAGICICVIGAALILIFDGGRERALRSARAYGQVNGSGKYGYSVRLDSRKGVEAVLPLLSAVPNLFELKILGVELNARDIHWIGRLKSLKTLWLNGCSLQGEELDPLNGLTNLVRVDLVKNPRLSDRGMKFLESLHNLESLRLTATGIRGPGIRYLVRLPHLRQLILTETLLTDETVGLCAELKHLKVLYIEAPGITTQGLMQLVTLHSLESLATPNAIVPQDRKRLGKAFVEARRKARAAGVKVPLHDNPPIDWFGG